MAIPLGLGGGNVDAALNNFVALHYESKHMSWLHSFWGVGATTGPLIMSFFL
ncbi:MAG TPA: MFS transporter, partial [Erysipelotrichaceae bacterium]|nr:MFS transporter [Erysipelotrichaceae bacterium]